MFTSSPAHPAHIYVKAGSLDDPSVVKPDVQHWRHSAVPWGLIDPTLPAHPRSRPR
jgi:hypothetical protein